LRWKLFLFKNLLLPRIFSLERCHTLVIKKVQTKAYFFDYKELLF